MDPPLLTFSVAVMFVFCSIIVESQQNLNPPPGFSSPPSSARPPPRSQSPPPRLLSPPRHRPPPYGVRNPGTNLRGPLEKEELNLGKEIGLVFAGVAAVLQVCVVAFLFISRRRFSKHENGD